MLFFREILQRSSEYVRVNKQKVQLFADLFLKAIEIESFPSKIIGKRTNLTDDLIHFFSQIYLTSHPLPSIIGISS